MNIDRMANDTCEGGGRTRRIRLAVAAVFVVASALACAPAQLQSQAQPKAQAQPRAQAQPKAQAQSQPQPQPQVPSAEYARGKALYESRCGLCHDRSVHGRENRSAKNFEEIRGFVVRWDRELGPIWRGDEINAVSRYLNERFYQFPCPESICGSLRAGGSGAARLNRG